MFWTTPVKCIVCTGGMRSAFRHTVLRKYDVQYFLCASCGFMQTETPYWLEEAYSTAIAVADTGLMQRNLHLANAASLVFTRLFRGEGRFLDAAGGYGIFTRLMRDIGFDYYWDDPHAQNLVARGFEGTSTQSPYSAVTAFEVLEHLPDPVDFLAQKLKPLGAKALLISTETFEGNFPEPEKWWYYTFNTGQHISFFQRSTLEFIGKRLGLRLFSNKGMHLWTNERLSAPLFKIMTTPRLAALLAWGPRMKLQSKVWSDHDAQLKS